jgi:isoaspartyl peptidase/L-asparaginase-like protein (Ntn-hydrolase superfamily)
MVVALMEHVPGIIVHGGAGDMDPSREADAVAGCEVAAAAGFAILEGGGSAVDAVCAAVRALEDNPLYNSGVGSVLTRVGDVEVDAALMDGGELRAGAIAAVPRGRNPIELARAVMEGGEHVMLSGEAAWEFLRERGFEPAPLEELVTERSRRRWEAVRDRRASGTAPIDPGTVGAVAIDAAGHVAAATSTGGMNFKRPGRIGDTPLFGCGTLADDRGGAASATGVGEHIIRVTMAAVAVDAMCVDSAEVAAWRAVDALARIDGSAGIICVDRDGGVGAAHNTNTMPVAFASASGERGAWCRSKRP